MDAINRLSIVIPVLNEEALIVRQVARVRRVAPSAQLIVVDGGSEDGTAEVARELADHFIEVAPGRSGQMNAGARMATGKYILFLHVDTQLPENFDSLLSAWVETDPMWGYFPLRLTGNAPAFRLIERMINLRTSITAGATGDQCQIIRADLFDAVCGFPQIPLMEDLALSRQLRKLMPPKVFPARVVSSSRRWEENGILRTVLLMWVLRSVYTLGLHPRYFFKSYQQCS